MLLQNVFENCAQILEEEKQRQLPIFAIFKKKVKETGILIDKPKREKPKTINIPENIAAVAESGREAPSTSIHRHFQQLNIETNFAERPWYDAIQSPIGSGVEVI